MINFIKIIYECPFNKNIYDIIRVDTTLHPHAFSYNDM